MRKKRAGEKVDIAQFGRMRYWTGRDAMTIEGRWVTAHGDVQRLYADVAFEPEA